MNDQLKDVCTFGKSANHEQEDGEETGTDCSSELSSPLVDHPCTEDRANKAKSVQDDVLTG